MQKDMHIWQSRSMENNMRTEYKNTNVKFNMADPMQAKAWNYLQEHKGTESYAKIIAWAISEANRVNDGCSQDTSTTPAAITESDIDRIAEKVADKFLDKGIAVKERDSTDLTEDSGVIQIAQHKSFKDKPSEPEQKEESEYNSAYLNQDLLDFASG